MYMLSNSTISQCTLNCTFAQVIMHSPIFIVSSGFDQLATCWVRQLWMEPKVANIDRFHCNMKFQVHYNCHQETVYPVLQYLCHATVPSGITVLSGITVPPGITVLSGITVPSGITVLSGFTVPSGITAVTFLLQGEIINMKIHTANCSEILSNHPAQHSVITSHNKSLNLKISIAFCVCLFKILWYEFS